MTEALLPEPHPYSTCFAQAVDDRLFSNVPIEARNKRITKIALRSLALPVAAVGRIPLIPFSKAHANGHPVYAGFLIYGEVGTFTGIGVWSVFKMTERECQPLYDSEKKVFGREGIHCKHIAMLTLSIALGAITGVPIAYIAYVGPTFQGQALGWALATEASEMLLATYAWQRNLLDLQLPPLNRKKRQAYFALCSARHKLSDMIEKQKFHLLQATPDQVDTYSAGFPTKDLIHDMEARIKALFEHILRKETELATPPTTLTKCINVAKKTLSGGLTLLTWAPNVYFTGFQAKKAGQLLYDEEWFGHLAATIISSAVAYVTFSGVHRTSSRLINFIHQIATCQKTDNPNMKKRLVLTSLTNLLGIVTGALAHGAIMHLTTHEFSDPNLQRFLQYTLIAGTVLFVTNALNDLLPIPHIHPLYTQLTALQSLLQNTQDPYLAAYLHSLPPNLRTQLTTTPLTPLLPPTSTDYLPLTNPDTSDPE